MNMLCTVIACLYVMFAIAVLAYDRAIKRNQALRDLINKCPLLHTTTCNNAELTWIKEAKTIIKENE